MSFRFLSLALAGIALFFSSSTLRAETFNGLVAYASCAEDGKITEAEHAACAKKTSRDDEVLVFAVSKKKVYEIFEEYKADDFVGKKVVIEGKLDQGFIEIETIRAVN